MRRTFLARTLAVCCLGLGACTLTPPEKYFDIAVLNCNMMYGFADEGLQRELESPSVKMVGSDKDLYIPMKRKEIIDNKINSIEPNFEKLKSLPKTDDTRELLQAALNLYSLVLPVYKNEYRHLADLYDNGAPKDAIEAYADSISAKYYRQYEELFNKLTAVGKPFAERHQIRVNWDVNRSPW